MSELYIGVMSGTSMDSIDVALCEVSSTKCTLKASLEFEFDKQFKKDILEAINSNTTLFKIGKIDHELGVMFASSINALLEVKSIDRKNINAIGLHGQTLWHEPDIFSMQLGDSNIVSSRTGIDVVSDFRRKDIALGGQGAPFAPAFHNFLFQHLDGVCVLNIGGMANVSLLGDNLSGYDTGVGNVLLDLWVSKHKNISYDKDGFWAKSGELSEKLLNSFFSEPYFHMSAPKSTGRELFNESWLYAHLEKFPEVPVEDVQRTLLELTVKTIADEIKKYPLKMVLVCGGGVKNGFLMQRLKKELNHLQIASTDEYGVSSDYMEAMAFAWLAKKRVHREVINLSLVTGAFKNGVLGAVYAKD